MTPEMTEEEWRKQDILMRLHRWTTKQDTALDSYGPNSVLIDDAVAEIEKLRGALTKIRDGGPPAEFESIAREALPK